MAKSQVIHEWKRPKAVGLYLSRRALRGVFLTCVCILFAGTVLSGLVLLLIEHLVPEVFGEVPATQILWKAIPPSLVMVCAVILFCCMAERWARATYRIDEEALKLEGSYLEKGLRWADVVACEYQGEHSEIPGVFSITVHLRWRKVSLWFENAEAAFEILDTMGRKCPGLSEPTRASSGRMSRFELCVMTVIFIAYSASAVWPVHKLLHSYGSKGILATLVIFVVGPGTVGSLLLRGKTILLNRRTRDVAFMVNEIAWFAILSTAGLIEVRYYVELIRSASG